LAIQHFDFDIQKLNLIIGDGRYFVNRAENQYDTIILDAFLGDSSPSHLMTREAFREMRRILKPKGTLVINSFGEFETGRDFFMASLDQTLRKIFPSVRIHASGNGNVFFVASDQPELEIQHPPQFANIHDSVLQSTKDAFAGLPKTDPAHGILLTDNYNPLEFYDATSREKHRRALAFHMKSL
jgi:spermidine synthase